MSTVWRTCIGCRSRATQTTLVRVVAVTTDTVTVITPDPRRSMPGRGAHVHPTAACVNQALRRKAFGRALRVEGPLDLHLVEALPRALDHDLTKRGPVPPTGSGALSS